MPGPEEPALQEMQRAERLAQKLRDWALILIGIQPDCAVCLEENNLRKNKLRRRCCNQRRLRQSRSFVEFRQLDGQAGARQGQCCL